MQCPNCGFESVQGPCPRCGAALPVAQRASLGRRHPALLISSSVSVFLLIVGSVGLVTYRLIGARSANGIQIQLQPGDQGKASTDKPEGLPIQHGNVARREELRGHGELYFVPVGKQAIPLSSLADYYRKKFGIQVTVLPPVGVQPSDCVPARKQCIAQELEAEVTKAYSEIARNPDSVMIALTDEDIFPRNLDWEFTYGWNSIRMAIVSTHRLDPVLWCEPADEELCVSRTKQMVTRYVAMQYFHLPENVDPTSVLYTDFTPQGGSDDIYESDLHPEESVNGQQGVESPCLFITYSYKTHRARVDAPLLSDCDYSNPAHADEDVFETDLETGHLTHRSLDLALDSTPKIEFRRGYNSEYRSPMNFALGWGTNHSYDAWLTPPDDRASFSQIDIMDEAGDTHFFFRVGKGRTFSPDAVYENHSEGIDGGRITWQGDHYKVQYRDGASSTFPSCAGSKAQCYWTGYEDAKGNMLHFDRGDNRELHQITATDRRGLNFKYDDSYRILRAEASNGKRVSYTYDAAGCLAQVQRLDGQIAFYEYDSNHRMTSFSVARRHGAAPKNVLLNQYDAKGRLIRQEIAGVGVFKTEYSQGQDEESELRVTTPTGQVLTIRILEDDYKIQSSAVRFQRAAK